MLSHTSELTFSFIIRKLQKDECQSDSNLDDNAQNESASNSDDNDDSNYNDEAQDKST